jgi:hypothetical protein
MFLPTRPGRYPVPQGRGILSAGRRQALARAQGINLRFAPQSDSFSVNKSGRTPPVE